MLDAINLEPYLKNIHWIINGGESGHHRRPFDTDWARSLRDQCKGAGVPYFMKQVDKVIEIPKDLFIREYPSFMKQSNNTYMKTTTAKTTPSLISTGKFEKAMPFSLTDYDLEMAKNMVAGLSKQKKVIGEYLLQGISAERTRDLYAKKNGIPLPTAQAYVTMVRQKFYEHALKHGKNRIELTSSDKSKEENLARIQAKSSKVAQPMQFIIERPKGLSKTVSHIRLNIEIVFED